MTFADIVIGKISISHPRFRFEEILDQSSSSKGMTSVGQGLTKHRFIMVGIDGGNRRTATMLNLQTISDRLELQDLAHCYARAVDSCDFEALVNDVFAPDGTIDFSAIGGPVGDVDAMLAWVRPGMAAYGNSHHLMANHYFKIDGDRATGRVMCYNPMRRLPDENGIGAIEVHGHYYVDEYSRTGAGWRIASRRLELTYSFDV
ncbi:nuclear transport factor 2 family protein [Sphingobium sp. AN558]|uniref:nuclear transport factor 2 family protein n=1 Tax=Sphingobium sp. AN558 TaxID=3133442 RepID=UPI0030C50B3D